MAGAFLTWRLPSSQTKEGAILVRIPEDIAADPIQAGIWAELCPEGNAFEASDLPNLRLLCFWHAVAREAQKQIQHKGKLSIFDPIAFKPFRDSTGAAVPLVRKSPALTVLKEASSEIRALSEALGITRNGRQPMQQPQQAGTNAALLQVVFGDREKRERRAHGA